MNFAKFLRTPFLTKHLQWLLLILLQIFKLHPRRCKVETWSWWTCKTYIQFAGIVVVLYCIAGIVFFAESSFYSWFLWNYSTVLLNLNRPLWYLINETHFLLLYISIDLFIRVGPFFAFDFFFLSFLLYQR